MFPKGNLNNLMKQFGKIQEELEKIQKELSEIRVEGSAGGGMVRVVANGKQEIISVKIDPEIIKEDLEMVEDMIVAATNQALVKAQEVHQEKMAALGGGLLANLPGGLKFPGL